MARSSLLLRRVFDGLAPTDCPWVLGHLSSLNPQLLGTQHPICEWHAAEAMSSKIRDFHAHTEIRRGQDENGNVVDSLKDYVYA